MASKSLKDFRITSGHRTEYPEDIARIKRVLNANGYSATDDQCSELWELYSDSYCAGWLFLPESDEEIFESVRRFMEDISSI